MSGQGSTSWRGRLKGQAVGRAKKLPLKSITRIVVVVALAGSAAFGGLADAAVPPIPVIEIGEQHAGAPASITVNSVSVVDELPGYFVELNPGETLLVVQAELLNEWSGPVRGPVDAVRVRGIDGLDASAPPEQLLLAADSSAVLSLQAGVPTLVNAVWRVPTATALPGTAVTIELFDLSLYTYTAVATGQEWTDPTLAATLSAVIEAVPDEAPDPDLALAHKDEAPEDEPPGDEAPAS